MDGRENERSQQIVGGQLDVSNELDGVENDGCNEKLNVAIVDSQGDSDTVSKSKKVIRFHKCQICFKVFPYKAHLREHEVKHSNKQPFSCPNCNKRFKRKNALKRHILLFHEERTDAKVCSCGKAFNSEDCVLQHQDCSGNAFVCHECGIYYKTQASLDNHMLLHSKDYANCSVDRWPFTCHMCNEKLSSKVALNNHISQTHSTKNFVCPLCGKTFKTKQFLLGHSLRKHKIGDQKFPCPVCSKVFLIPKDLRRHMQSHNPEGTHTCLLCHKKFKAYANLQSHMKIHSKNKPYDCMICLFPSASLDELRSHFLLEHDIQVGESFVEHWNRKCLVCGQMFFRRSTLATHMRMHFNQGNLDTAPIETSESTSDNSGLGRLTGDSLENMGNIEKGKDGFIKGERAVLQVSMNKTCNQALREPSFRKKVEVASSVSDSITDALGTEKSQIVQAFETDQTLLSSHAVAKSSTSNDDETKYICGQCSSVFTDVEDLKTHLVTCYREETSDDYVVVFEVEENN